MILSILKAFTSSRCKITIVATLYCFSVFANKDAAKYKNPQHTFTENKGQVSDQNYQARPDVLFYGTEGPLSFHLKSNGISYQQSRVEKWKEEKDPITDKPKKIAALTSIYRVDINWLKTNPQPLVTKLNPADGFSTYYSAACQNGVSNVRSYSELVYKHVYDGIDIRWYYKNDHLKYDYIIAAGASYKNIQLQIKGATKLSINLMGELVIETPLGKIIEEAPYVTQGNKKLNSKWVITNNVASFEIDGVDAASELIIDPGVRVWGSYYGGNAGDSGLQLVTDSNDNLYVCGTTSSANGTSIATSGSHQSIYGGGVDNAWVAKFNGAGVRQWATYYGGTVREFGLSCAVDNAGNVFLAGHSFGSPGTAVATVGSHQPAFGGDLDGYLVKFNNNGIRQWGTFYGGPGTDNANAVAVDANGNSYITGRTEGAATSSMMVTPGSHQSVFGGVEDCYLAKFNGAGVRQWATYYGGGGTDMGRGLDVDAAGNVFMVGWTDNSVPNIMATPGSHQNTFGGGSLDAFLVKFDPSGVRQWGTQYGGSGTDMAYDCEVDLLGNVYMCGKTGSTFSIATVNSHQPVYGGGPQDAFLVSFNSSGIRNWATYYGGTGDEEAWGCAVHKTGHVYISGSTSSVGGTVIATAGSHLSSHGGGIWDAFIAQFDPTNNGSRMWGSYYGETGDDLNYSCTTDNAYHVFISGATDTNTGTGIASTGSHQDTYGNGWGDGYFAKFYDCPAPLAPTNTTVPNNLLFCANNSTTLSVISSATVNWYSTPTSTTSLGTGTTYITPILPAGLHTYYVESTACTVSIVRTPITITVNPNPSLPILATPTVVCAGKSVTLSVSGADTYTWDNGANTNVTSETPSVTTVYTIMATSSVGCVGSNTISITVHPLDIVTLTPEKNVSCLTIFGGTPIALTGAPPGGILSGPNVSNGFLNPTALGTFNPTYTYLNSVTGCTNTASTAIIVVSCMSVSENTALNSLSVYPNPTKGLVTIEDETDLEKTISISDVNGKLLKTEKTKAKKHSLNISEYANGIYFLKVISNTAVREFKLVKE